MGIPPGEALAMSLHDYQAALYFFAKAQGSDDDDEAPLSADEFDDMLADMTSVGLH